MAERELLDNDYFEERRRSDLIFSKILDPIPFTFLMSSMVLNGPFSVRYLTIASALLGPIPAKEFSIVLESAELMLTGVAKIDVLIDITIRKNSALCSCCSSFF